MKSRSIAGVGIAAACDVPAEETDAEETDAEEGIALGAADGVGAEDAGATTAELNNGGITELVDDVSDVDGADMEGDTDAADTASAVDAADVAGASVIEEAGVASAGTTGATDAPTGDGAMDAPTVGEAADNPGGGAATASGSSISSSGKSGNCSWNGEAGTPAKPFGTAVLTGTVDAAGTGAGAGAAVAVAVAAAPPVNGFAAAESSPEATPTGLEVFLAPATAASELDALRGAALATPEALDGLAPLIGTPTGREPLAGFEPDGEDATLGL